MAIGLLLLSLVVVSGCRDDRGKENARQAAEYRRLLDSSGKRVLIVDAKGERLHKLRKRRAQIKAYDEDLKALGYVRWEHPMPEPGSDVEAEEPRPVAVRIKVLGEEAMKPLTSAEPPPGAPRTVKLDGRFELVEMPADADAQAGWKVLGPDSSVEGVFWKLGPDEWQLSTEAKVDAAAKKPSDFGVQYRAKQVKSPERMQLTRDKKVVATIQFGDLSPVEFLALQINGLSLLERIAIGVWLTQNAP